MCVITEMNLFKLKKDPNKYIKYLEERNRQTSLIRKSQEERPQQPFVTFFSGANANRSNELQVKRLLTSRKKWFEPSDHEVAHRIQKLSPKKQNCIISYLEELEAN